MNKIFQGFYKLRCVRFELFSLVYYVVITHGQEIKYLIGCLHYELYLFVSTICLLYFGIVSLRVPLVEQDLLIFPQHPSSPAVFSGVRVTPCLFLCVLFCRSFFPFYALVLFLLAIVLSVLLRFTDSDYPFGIFKLF